MPTTWKFEVASAEVHQSHFQFKIAVERTVKPYFELVRRSYNIWSRLFGLFFRVSNQQQHGIFRERVQRHGFVVLGIPFTAMVDIRMCIYFSLSEPNHFLVYK